MHTLRVWVNLQFLLAHSCFGDERGTTGPSLSTPCLKFVRPSTSRCRHVMRVSAALPLAMGVAQASAFAMLPQASLGKLPQDSAGCVRGARSRGQRRSSRSCLRVPGSLCVSSRARAPVRAEDAGREMDACALFDSSAGSFPACQLAHCCASLCFVWGF